MTPETETATSQALEAARRQQRLYDARARHRGFRDASHLLDVMDQALGRPGPHARAVMAEYRAVFMGEMWRHRMRGPR